MTFALGILIGLLAGGGATASLLNGTIAGAYDDAEQHRKRARNLHRRAQKAEGRLQRINRILVEGDEE